MKRFAAFLGVTAAILLVAFLFARDRDVPREELIARYGGPPSQWIGLPGGALAHVRDQGRRDGPVLFLVHGSNASLHTWEPWVARLGDALRIVSMDLPGHGLTGPVPGDDYSRQGMADFVEALRTQLGIERFSIAGSSMGGGVSWRYALDHPEHLQTMILIGSSGPRPPDLPEESGALAFRLAAMPGVNRLLEHVTPIGLIRDGLRAAIEDDDLVTPEMVERYHALLLHPGSRRANRIRFALHREPEPVETFRGITTPTLLMWGEKDALVSVEIGAYLDQYMPDSRLVVYPGVGHLPMEEVPDLSAADVRRFLTEQGVIGPGARGD